MNTSLEYMEALNRADWEHHQMALARMMIARGIPISSPQQQERTSPLVTSSRARAREAMGHKARKVRG